MTLLETTLGNNATARSARESCGTTDRPRRQPSPLAARTAALLQRLRAQQGLRAGLGPICSAADLDGQPVAADADLNRIHLTGCLGSEPLLYDVADHPVASLALACARRWHTSTGTLQVETLWFNLSAWEELAEQCGRLLHRGDRVYVEGSLHLWAEIQASQSYACHTVVLDRIVLLAAGSTTNERSVDRL